MDWSTLADDIERIQGVLSGGELRVLRLAMALNDLDAYGLNAADLDALAAALSAACADLIHKSNEIIAIERAMNAAEQTRRA